MTATFNPYVFQILSSSLFKGCVESVAMLNIYCCIRCTMNQKKRRSIKDVAKLQKLYSLCLHGTQITDAGLKKLAKLKKSKFLSLFRTKVTDEDVAKLKKALPNCKIIGT